MLFFLSPPGFAPLTLERSCYLNSFAVIDPASVLDSEHTIHENGHVDTLGATNELMIKDGNELLASQVKAFLEASENVNVDSETIEDILQALLVDKENAGDAETCSNTKMDEYEDSDEELEASTQEIDISSLFQRNREGILFSPPTLFFTFRVVVKLRPATGTWSKQEIKQMLHLLKERG